MAQLVQIQQRRANLVVHCIGEFLKGSRGTYVYQCTATQVCLVILQLKIFRIFN